jgi:hypothetical protein
MILHSRTGATLGLVIPLLVLRNITTVAFFKKILLGGHKIKSSKKVGVKKGRS